MKENGALSALPKAGRSREGRESPLMRHGTSQRPEVLGLSEWERVEGHTPRSPAHGLPGGTNRKPRWEFGGAPLSLGLGERREGFD